MPATDTEAAAAGFVIPADDAPVHMAPSYFRQNARAAAVGGWLDVTGIHASLSVESAGLELKCRLTPLGVQYRGKYSITSSIAMDAVLWTQPATAGVRPTTRIRMHTPAMDSGSGGYKALAYQVELRDTGEVTARQAMSSGQRISFDFIMPLYND